MFIVGSFKQRERERESANCGVYRTLIVLASLVYNTSDVK